MVWHSPDIRPTPHVCMMPLFTGSIKDLNEKISHLFCCLLRNFFLVLAKPLVGCIVVVLHRSASWIQWAGAIEHEGKAPSICRQLGQLAP